QDRAGLGRTGVTEDEVHRQIGDFRAGLDFGARELGLGFFDEQRNFVAASAGGFVRRGHGLLFLLFVLLHQEDDEQDDQQQYGDADDDVERVHTCTPLPSTTLYMTNSTTIKPAHAMARILNFLTSGSDP